MAWSTVGSRGRLTVPESVRERLGLRCGDQVVFELEGDSVRLTVARRKGLEESRGTLPASTQYPGKEGEREAARGHAVEHVLGKPEA